MIKIELKVYEVAMASSVALRRSIDSMKKKHRNKHGFEKGKISAWDSNIMGALGECAVAKALDRFWSGGVGTYKGADVGDTIQVRYTLMDPPALIVRPGDNPDHHYFLVTGGPTDFYLWGWIKGSGAAKKKWSKAPHGRPPAYFVPIEALKPLENFRG